MAISSLVLGLGGSGAWTVAHVKKQLLDSYNNQLPPNVALAIFDTAAQPLKDLDLVAPIAPQEYTHIGGDAFELVRKVDGTDEYPHISSWLLAHEYLSELPRAVYNLHHGAGQFRQFGRLALFRSVITPHSPVVSILDNKLTAIARMTQGKPAISVSIVGSLAGGTGAGLFLDIPHLIRQVADARGDIEVTLRGFFYLPQAFRRTLNRQDLQFAEPRAFAALRELDRFLLNRDYEYGYPMYYHPPGQGTDSTLWRAKNQGKLYDFVYLLDGEGPAQINARELKDGTAAVVADAIVNYVDESYGRYQQQDVANVPLKIQERQDRVGRRAFIGTLGAYSIILPIQQMIRLWSYRLGADLIGSLVPPEPGMTDEHGHIRQLDRDANPERERQSHSAELERLMTSNASVVDPTSEDQSRVITPTPLWRRVHSLSLARRDNENQLLRQLEAYTDPDSWLQALAIPGLQADAATRRVIAETKAALEDDIFDHVQPSDKRKPKGNPVADLREISEQADQYLIRQLGVPADGGGRRGGAYAEALQRFADLQVQRLQQYLAVYISNTLNGIESRDRELAKEGKLGWLLRVMEEMRDAFGSVYELLSRLREGTVGRPAHRQRGAAVEEALNDALRKMQARSGDRSRIGRDPACQAQEDFLIEVQNYVRFHRTQFARDALALTTGRIRNLLNGVIAQLEQWGEILATDLNSLYNELYDAGRAVEGELQRAESVANHRVINDSAWMEERYQQYVGDQQARPRIFESWQWTMVPTTNSKGQPALTLEASLGGEAFRSDRRGRWSEANLAVVVNACRAIFEKAVENESILQYLMQGEYADNPERLGQELAENAGYLLAMHEGTDVGGRIMSNTLLARYNEEHPEETAFLHAVLAELVAQRGGGDITIQDDPDHRNANCSDPFRLTLISTAELVPLQEIKAYQDSMIPYMALPYNARRRHHIFPAEVHAVKYEEQLQSRLEQKKRLLEDRVILLLENEDRFREFLVLLAHNVIVFRDNPDGEHTEFLWLLQVPPERGQSVRIENLWLSAPTQSTTPSFIDPMITYVILEQDYRTHSGQGFHRDLPYRHIRQYLQQVYVSDTQSRVERDALALCVNPADPEDVTYDQELRIWLEAFMPPLDEDGYEIRDDWTEDDDAEFKEMATFVVRHDVIRELVDRLRLQLPYLRADVEVAREALQSHQTHDEVTRAREEYDVCSVAVICLEEERERLRHIIEDRYNARVGYGPSYGRR